MEGGSIVSPSKNSVNLPSYCPNCAEKGDWVQVFRRPELVACKRCGGWTWRGAADSSGALYEEDYFTAGEYANYERGLVAHATNFRRKLRLLAREVVLREARLFEVGCATGAFLVEARQAGVPQSLGLEVSVWARARCAEAGFDVMAPSDPGVSGAVRGLNPNLLVAWDTWEHLADPAGFFAPLLEFVSQDGIVALTTVDASSVVARTRRTRWRQFHPPTHLNYPTRASFRRFFATHGFEITYHRSFGYFRPLLEYLRVLGIHKLPDSLAELESVPVYLDLFDTQMCIARRRALGA